jgi:tRNA-2-methylthio-N6-dimethylallyladenosine synthase
LFAFCYSPRPGTPALRLPDPPVPTEIAEARLQDLLKTQNVIQRELNEELVGREFEVLVTGWGREEGVFTGRTTCHRIMHFRANDPGVRAGHLAHVRVIRANPHSLVGEEVA